MKKIHKTFELLSVFLGLNILRAEQRNKENDKVDRMDPIKPVVTIDKMTEELYN